MDSKGRAIGNVFTERLWRSVKYEYLYLNPPADGLELYQGLKQWLNDYNGFRPHYSLSGLTSNEFLALQQNRPEAIVSM